MSVGGRESTCSHCGKKLESSAKTECPSCGEPVRKGLKKCPVCHADLQGTPARGKPKSSKKATETKPKSSKKKAPDQEAPVLDKESTQVRDEDKKFSCPKCSGLLIGTELKCPRCGQGLRGKSGFRCRTCGTPVMKGVWECPTCVAAAKISEEAKPEIPLDSKAADESSEHVSVVERPATRPCPFCGAIIPDNLQKCPLCNTNLVEAAPPEEDKVADAESSMAHAAEDSVPAKAVVDAQTIEPAVIPDAGSSTAQSIEDSAPAPAMVDAQTAKPARVRKVRTAKTSAPPVTTQTSPRGRVNGVGQVNGLSRAKGADAATGEAFVNGTGISNGLGARPRESSTKRSSFLARWQLLAVLVAIIIVIPTFIFLSYSNESERFTIDGNYSDWDGATTFGTKVQSTAATSNITEWAIAIQSSDLFLYIRTQANMMSPTNAESYYLFVDSDGSNATGYVMKSIGADYMLQLTGWDSAVKSTSLSKYTPSSDRYNWSAWTSIGSLSYSLDLVRLEARAMMPAALEQSAMFVLLSKDSADRGSVSYTTPLKGGVLVVEQVPTAEVTTDGVLPKSNSVTMLNLTFTCEGKSGRVDKVNPTLAGATMTTQVLAFDLAKGGKHVVSVAVDTSSALDAQFVSVEMLASGFVSSFASVEIIGSGASAYVTSPPSIVAIDGAFADWAGRLSKDQDSLPITSASTDIDEVGNASNAQDSFFYVSVEGDMCSGTFVPAMVTKPTGPGGGGAVVQTRHTAEDILRVYVDSDKSNSSGFVVALNSKQIGADQLIEVKGLFGKITSTKEFDYSSSGTWVEMGDVVDAAKDTKRIEISVSAASIGGSADIDYIVETTSWKGRSDLATFDPSSMSSSTRTWVVDPTSTSPFATSMSYQRKMFYDGVNYWSFFFDGTNTVHKYSVDDGHTWMYCGQVFATPGVQEVSIWYDPSTSTVYAVGDTSVATNAVLVKAGVVDASSHTVSWAAVDSVAKTSAFPIAGKNAYICKDLNGYLWVLASNLTTDKPAKYGLSAFMSRNVNSTNSWIDKGQVLPWLINGDDTSKGSIVPAGSGSDVWVVCIYQGYVSGRKYNGTWQADQRIYTLFGSTANTDNSPPSVVVDKKGVVHVVHGTGNRAGGGLSIPLIMYSHNNTDMTFTPEVNLDPDIPDGIGDYYPTISLDTSTGNLYALWLRGDAASVPKTVMGKVCVAGTWSNITIGSQTTYTKQYLTSVYSVSGEYKICWQWTQNVTTPIDVVIDHQEIPELGALSMPVMGIVLMVTVYSHSSRKKKRLSE